MVRVRTISKEEAQQTRATKAPGVRRRRMNQFDEYARAVLENPDQAAVFEEIEEEPQKFVLSLRGALHRAGVYATVRKMRGRDEVRVWLSDRPPTRAPRGNAGAAAKRPTKAAAAPSRGRRTQR